MGTNRVMAQTDVMVLGDATFRLTTEKWISDARAVKRIRQNATQDSRTFDEILADIVAKFTRADVELRAIDYAGGW